jgi:tryptophan-rich sensory protein
MASTEVTDALAEQRQRTEKEPAMLWTIAIILVILWLLGMVSFHALGGYVHLLLILAIIVVLIRIIQGRNPV